MMGMSMMEMDVEHWTALLSLSMSATTIFPISASRSVEMDSQITRQEKIVTTGILRTWMDAVLCAKLS
jgi:hypothetical protein